MAIGTIEVLALACVAVAVGSYLRVRKAERLVRKSARRQAFALERVQALLRRLAETAPQSVEAKVATAAEIEAFVAKSYGAANADVPVPSGTPEAYDRPTEEEQWALEWDAAGRPETWAGPGGVMVEFTEAEMANNRALFKAAKEKMGT